MRILFIGDIVGKPGRDIVVPRRRRAWSRDEQLDLVVANAENAAGGSGLTPAIYRELIARRRRRDHARRPRLSPQGDLLGARERAEHRQAGQLAARIGRPRLGRRHGPQRRAGRRSPACWASCS